MRTLILVDDDPLIHRLVELAARAAGVTAAHCEVGGERAVELVRQLVPDVVLLDLYLPVASGLETLALLRADPVTASVPVVLLTAAADAELLVAAKRSGASAVLSKPLPPATLIATIERALQRSARAAASRDVERAVAELRAELAPQLRARVAELEQAARTCLRVAPNAAMLRELERVAHRLAGTAGSYGFHEVSRAARRIELAAAERVEPGALAAATAALRVALAHDGIPPDQGDG